MPSKADIERAAPRFVWRRGDVKSHASVTLARTWVPPYVREGERVEGYWREVPDTPGAKPLWKPLERDDVVDVLVRGLSGAYKGWLTRLGSEDPSAVQALRDYHHGGAFRAVNAHLRGRTDVVAREMTETNRLRQLPDEVTPEEIREEAERVLPGLRRVFAQAPKLNVDLELGRAVAPEALAGLEVGQRYTDPGYVSTTFANFTLEYIGVGADKVESRVIVPTGTRVVYADALDEIDEVESDLAYESEIILDAGTVFELVSKDPLVLRVVP